MLSSHKLRAPALFSLALLAWQTPALAQGDTFYSGSAIGAIGTVKVAQLQVRLALAENYMSCIGTPKTETIVSISNPAPLGIQSKTVTTFTSGRDSKAIADTKMQDVQIDFPGLMVTASAVTSRAVARCVSPGVIATSGGSTLTNLKINGEGVQISGEKNQTIDIPNVGSVVINQQVKRKEGEFTSFRAVALRVKLLPDAPVSSDISLASSKAAIFCD